MRSTSAASAAGVSTRELRRMPFAVPSQRGFTKSGKPSAVARGRGLGGALEGRVGRRGHARRRHDSFAQSLVEGRARA